MFVYGIKFFLVTSSKVPPLGYLFTRGLRWQSWGGVFAYIKGCNGWFRLIFCKGVRIRDVRVWHKGFLGNFVGSTPTGVPLYTWSSSVAKLGWCFVVVKRTNIYNVQGLMICKPVF